MFNLSWLLSPWAILIAILSGGGIGLANRELALQLLPFGMLYMQLLQMLVLPIILTAVISGLGNLFLSGIGHAHVVRFILHLLSGLLLAGIVGVAFGYFGKPGAEIQHHAQVTLGKTISKTESKLPMQNSAEKPALLDFFGAMIPENIFRALRKGDNLAILFFSIIVGVALGLKRSPSSQIALTVVQAFFDIFLNIIGWIMYLLPFGLLCLFAGQLAQIGVEIVWATAKLVVFIYTACIAAMFGYSLLIWRKTYTSFSYLDTLAAVRAPLLIALGTASSLATIPASLNALKNNLQIDKNVCDLVIPIGTTINPPASVLQFAVSSVFIAQLYGYHLGIHEMGIILVGSILAGLASSSTPSVIGLNMIAITLDPLGLPTAVAVILLVAIDPIVDPIVTALNVHANCAMTVLAAEEIRDDTPQTKVSA